MKRTKRGQNREINRELRSMVASHNDRNATGKAAQRRRNQMLRGQLKAENGVVTMSSSEADDLIAALNEKGFEVIGG